MSTENDHLETLTEIRSLMERSSRFISLSGLSGVFAGIFALLGAAAAYMYLNLNIGEPDYYRLAYQSNGEINWNFFIFLSADAFLVLFASLSVGSIFTIRKARKRQEKLWDATAKRMSINMMIPLVSGGLFCLLLLYHGLVGLVAPVMLIFYGLALINASKYTLDDIRYLGLMEIGLGLLATFYLGYGLLFWAAGFGVLHIIYGIAMYNKYER